MKTVNVINLRTNEYRSKKVDQVELHIGDMWFYRDITDDRDITMAERIAEGNGIVLNDYRIEL